MRTFRSFFSDLLGETRRDPDTQVAALQGLWPHLAGEKVSTHSQPVRLRDSTLRVETASPRWTQELEVLEQLLIGKINRFWGVRLIDRIEFKTRLARIMQEP